MKVTVVLVKGALTIADMDQETVLPMVEAFGDESVSVLALVMGEAMTYVNKRNIIRIDVD